MKRILAFILCVVTCLSMTGCALFSGEHSEHKFKRKWESNSVYHWHECRFGDCNEKGNYEKHVYENGECTKCGHKEQSFGTH